VCKYKNKFGNKQEKERKLAIIRIIAYLCKSTIRYEYGKEISHQDMK